MNEVPTNNDGYQPQPSQEPNTEPASEKSYIQPEFIPQPATVIVPSTEPIPPVQPAPLPQVEVASPSTSSPGLIVLQWLTYALWGWTLIATSILAGIVLTFFLIKDSSIGDAPLYFMAAVLVLLPISTICDIFYSKHEPVKKSGASSVAMIINAVIFALFGIGSLIAVVFSLVTLFISSSNLESTLVTLYVAIIVAILFGALFLRTILPKKLYGMRRFFIIFMMVAIGTICAFSIFGPTIEARLTRNDKLIASNLDIVSDAVNSYTSTNDRLPDSLSTLKLADDAKKLVSDNLVSYKKDTKSSSVNYLHDKTFYYQLCVTYKKASGTSNDIYRGLSEDDEYSSYISTYYHPSGYTCYKVETTNYNKDYTAID